MNEEDYLHDVELIRRMRVDDKKKVGMLNFLFSSKSNPWRVVGITKSALELFSKNGFKNKSGLGVNRSHYVKSRHETFLEILKIDFKDGNEMHEYHYKHDVTILATSSENMKEGNNLDYWKKETYFFNENSALFKSQGYGWKHGKDEQAFLKNLYEEKFKNNDPNAK